VLGPKGMYVNPMPDSGLLLFLARNLLHFSPYCPERLRLPLQTRLPAANPAPAAV